MKKNNCCSMALILMLALAVTYCTGCCGIFNDFLNPVSQNGKINNPEDTPAGSSETSAGNAADTKETGAREPMRLKIYADPKIPAQTAKQVISYFKKSINEYNEGVGADKNANSAAIDGFDADSSKEDTAIGGVDEDKGPGDTSIGSVGEDKSANGTAIDGFDAVYEKSSADFAFEFVSAEESGNLKGPVYFAPVVSFYSLAEEISWSDLKDLWKGKRETIKDIEGNEIAINLVLDSETLKVLLMILGECNVKNLSIKGPDEIKASVAADVNVLSIVPFDQIVKEYKVLSIDGKSILDKNITFEQYPLSGGIEISVSNNVTNNVIYNNFKKILDRNFDNSELSNRSQDDMVSILITGVTALTRQVADRMDRKGILYPAEKILDTLLDADITHISNEVSFVEDCYAAKPNTMVFCSKPEYMQLLEYIDTDVLELTGNHMNDYGSKWFDYTLDIYDKAGIDYFGGGRNLEDAQKAATFDIGGYKFAFLGANTFGPSSVWATDSTSGAAPINTLDAAKQEKDMQKYEEMIKKLKSEGYNVIFTFQYLETYSYSPTGQQVKDFERMADAGAVIVNGSQAHQPQGFEIRENGFINFGLGNLFFGQAAGLHVKQGMIAKHIFYKGKHINTVMKTIYIEDLSQPRLTEGQERADLLRAVFQGSIINKDTIDIKN